MSGAECDCYRCVHERGEAEGWGPLDPRWQRYFLCASCGNKRCPHATDHRLVCTGSNVTGQAGSNYGSEVLDLVGVRELLASLGTEAGSISEWAHRRGLHPENALVFARGDREPSPALLRAMGLRRESVFLPALQQATSTPSAAVGEWQDIASAPRDGTYIDLWAGDDEDGERFTGAYWGFPQHSCGEYGRLCDSCPPREGWVDSTFNTYIGGEDGVGDDPTHWMPQPQPPASPTPDRAKEMEP